MNSSIRGPVAGESAICIAISLVCLSAGDQLCTGVFVFLSNRSDTLPLATKYNIKCVGLSPDGRLAIIVDEGNRFWCG